MTRSNLFKKLKSKLCIFLALVCTFCCALTLFTACAKTEETITDPAYTYTESENTDTLIANSSFSLNVKNSELSSFPSSPSNWTKSTENSTKSTVDSGVINTTEDGFKALLTKLYADTDFVDYVYNYNKDAITEKVKADTGKESPTDSEIKDYLKDKAPADYFKNPVKREGASDDFVYMLNNYGDKGYYGKGAAQKVTSSSSITIEAGKTYKISVWVYTNSIAKNGVTDSATLSANNASSDGVNIRLANSFNGNAQAEYRINNIDTKNTWKEYNIYVKGDKDYDSTVTLTLGLGYGLNDTCTEGTAFFDDITCKELKADETIPNTAIEDAISYGSEDKIVKSAATDVDFVLDMTMDLSASLTPLNFSNTDADYGFTKSNVKNGNGDPITSENKFGADVSKISTLEGKGTDTLTVGLEKASYTVKISSAEFTVAPETFNYVSFYITNKLSKFGSTEITVNVVETDATDPDKTYVYPAIATFSEVSDTAVKCDLVIKNNFPSTFATRNYYLEIVIGPTKVNEVNIASEYASGEVIISNVNVYKNSFNNSLDVENYTDEEKNAEYKLFNGHISSTADATVALYKLGYDADYSEESNTESYNLGVAPGNVGEIVNKPTAVKGYTGITANHIYLKEQVGEEVLNTLVNERMDFTNEKGYAGLINSKYLSNYAQAELNTELANLYTADENIQPIVIYNKVDGHYGFVGTSNSIAASAYAKVSVTLKVDATAKAFVYLANTSKINKDLLTFPKVNEAEEQELYLEVTNTNGKWKTVEFYIGNGATAQDFRVEIWNGGRDGQDATKSQGFVFVKDITVTTASAFTEPTSQNNAFSTSGNPLYQKRNELGDSLISFTRELTSTEKEFNKEYPDQAVSYSANYVWAKSGSMIYAIYNTIDPVETDPYANIEEEAEEGSGCTAETDPSTFWLSFASILLAAILVFAIVALIVKNVRRRRKANKSDAKSHYKVKSRIEISKENKKRVAKLQKEEETEEEVETPANEDETIEQPTEENIEETETVTPAEQDLDAYVYGDVQDFGDAETNEEKTEEESSDKE